MPWKNGGGVTTEIAVFPQDAGLDGFGWRVSMADVTGDGPFSQFPGIDRTLAVLDGNGMTLGIESPAPLNLAVGEMASFPADVATSARLIDGPIRDLNVMSRRDVFHHTVRLVSVEDSSTITIDAPDTLLLCRSGQVSIGLRQGAVALKLNDCLHLKLMREPETVRLTGPASLYLIEFLASTTQVARTSGRP